MDKQTIARTTLAAILLAAAVAMPAGAKAKPAGSANDQLLKREEMMVYNLNRGPKSARFYMLQSLKSTRAIQRDLEKAQHQIEQVDAAYAKARGHSDERTMQPSVARLQAALKASAELERELDACSDELKADIQQTLLRQ